MRDVIQLREKLLKRLGRAEKCAVCLGIELVVFRMVGDRPDVVGERVQGMRRVVVHFHVGPLPFPRVKLARLHPASLRPYRPPGALR